MHILINALSVTNTSGRHVLMGHLKTIVPLNPSYNYTVLYHDINKDMKEDLGPTVQYLECPVKTAQWAPRYSWENKDLPQLVKEIKADCHFSPAGLTVPSLKIPQVAFCQNPWCLVPAIHHNLKEKLKAWMQRKAYKKAQQQAQVMVYNSQYMLDAYKVNAGFTARKAIVAYQGLNEKTFTTAAKWSRSEKKKNELLTVSAMGNHKGVETVIRALAILKEKHNKALSWKIIGAWPDPSYRESIDRLIQKFDLAPQINIAGHVSREELERSYAEAGIFCLMSQCESFGIPAIEAQAYGTPVICSNTCAMPEVDGEGGLYPEVNNPEDTAEKILQLLSDDDLWTKISKNAQINAERFHWEKCSPQLLAAFDHIKSQL